MLHDLFLMSEYFEPPFSAIREEDLIESYGHQSVYMALSMGLIERKCAPCASKAARNFYVLSQSGLDFVINQADVPKAVHQVA